MHYVPSSCFKIYCPSLSFLGLYTQFEKGHSLGVPGAQKTLRAKGIKMALDTSVGEREEVYFFKPKVFMMHTLNKK